MIILHGNVYRDEFLLWAESSESPFADSASALQSESRPRQSGAGNATQPSYLPFGASYSQMRDALGQSGITIAAARRRNAQATVWLPALNGAPLASSTMIVGADSEDLAGAQLVPYVIPALRLEPEETVDFLCRCIKHDQLLDGVLLGQDLHFWALSLQFAGMLVARQQFLPGLRVSAGGGVACWDPVFLGDDGERLIRLVQGMPDLCLSYEPLPDESSRHALGQSLVECFLGRIVDFLVRKFVEVRSLPVPGRIALEGDVLETRDIHSRWLESLLNDNSMVSGTQEEIARLCHEIAEWRRPVEISSEAPFRLRLRLEEPESIEPQLDAGTEGGGAIGQENGANASRWYLRFLLQSLHDPGVLLPVDAVLSPQFQHMSLMRSGRIHAREYLFRALGQAVRLCPAIGASFDEKVPVGIWFDTHEAYEFLSRTAASLKNAGFSVQLPSWWTARRQKIAAKINVSPFAEQGGLFSLSDLAEFDWQLSLGSTPVSVEELEQLSRLKIPLVNMNGNWVELNPEQLGPILHFFKKRCSQRASGRELIKMALGDVRLPDGVAFEGVAGDGPVSQVIQQLRGQAAFEEVPVRDEFSGTLRPYQSRGMSWFHFLRSIGFGACLADDMGLGKTVQTLAFVQSVWHQTPVAGRLPSLLVCPTSVIGNWQSEVAKFTPELDVLLHHGLDRLHGPDFRRTAQRSCLVLTTYSLLLRDQEDLKSIKWENVILDEAQNIKNPEAHQTKAACSLRSNFRIALSGTPVENNVGDLWSLMNFLNPGYLGRFNEFKDRFFVPIQVCQNAEKSEQLKRLTAPFILRRLKTDKSIAPDLPEKHERKTNCYLTKEQATLYAAVVESATNSIDAATGIKRKSLVLTTLLRLKQICDHPALFISDRSRIADRSGKLKRLSEMARSIIDGGERLLIFTQFKQMGSIIQTHLECAVGREVLFLHGGIERSDRVRMVEKFQSDPDGPPIFVLSLKAGGTGLNLTRANHVFHFDRWWNPAVEDQATDRAYRIGQTSNVQVHKFVCAGTLEERIDDLIERKKVIAANTVGTGEGWLTELSTAELRDVFALRETALVC